MVLRLFQACVMSSPNFMSCDKRDKDISVLVYFAGYRFFLRVAYP